MGSGVSVEDERPASAATADRQFEVVYKSIRRGCVLKIFKESLQVLLNNTLYREFSYFEVSVWIHTKDSFAIVIADGTRHEFSTIEGKVIADTLMESIVDLMQKSHKRGVSAKEFDALLLTLRGEPPPSSSRASSSPFHAHAAPLPSPPSAPSSPESGRESLLIIDRLQVLQTAFPFALFTAQQIIVLLRSDLFLDPFDRIEVILITFPKLLHPDTIELILNDAFADEADRINIRLRLSRSTN